jgi:hypothetical protein
MEMESGPLLQPQCLPSEIPHGLLSSSLNLPQPSVHVATLQTNGSRQPPNRLAHSTPVRLTIRLLLVATKNYTGPHPQVSHKEKTNPLRLLSKSRLSHLAGASRPPPLPP